MLMFLRLRGTKSKRGGMTVIFTVFLVSGPHVKRMKKITEM